MQFERLRKSHKKQIIIGAIAVCVIGGALTFSLTRAKYEIANDLELAKGTINYKAYDFKIMAMYKSDDKINYTEIEEMPSEGYTINESKSYCNMSNENKDEPAILKTIDGNHIISKLKKNDKCFIYFDKTISPITIDEIIPILNAKTETPDFSQIATTDEGVYAIEDGMYGGISYYWRGSATTNYLKFAGFCWRIIRINGDGSLRLIYDGNICHNNGVETTDNIAMSNIVYNLERDKSEYVGWTYVEGKQRPEMGDTAIDSNVKIKTEEWYKNNIEKNTTYASKVADGKFCNDREVEEGYHWFSYSTDQFSYKSNIRNRYNNNPTLNCINENDIYNIPFGFITSDEIVFAGGKWQTSNNKYFLYNGQNYWTISPTRWWHSNTNHYSLVFVIKSDGSLMNSDLIGDSTGFFSGIRPVINLRSDVTFSGGNGTLDNPYIVAD